MHLPAEVVCSNSEASRQPPLASKQTERTQQENRNGRGKPPRAQEGVREVTAKTHISRAMCRDRTATDRQATGVRGSFPATPKDQERGLEGAGDHAVGTGRPPERHERIIISEAFFGEPAGESEETVWVTPRAGIKTEARPKQRPPRPTLIFVADPENTPTVNSEGALQHSTRLSTRTSRRGLAGSKEGEECFAPFPRRASHQ